MPRLRAAFGYCILIGLLILVVVAGIYFLVNVFNTRRGINNYSYEQIRDGMTVSDVEALLGAPPGWYAPPWMRQPGAPLLDPKVFTAGGAPISDGSVLIGWAGEDLLILLYVDKHSKVKEKLNLRLVLDPRATTKTGMGSPVPSLPPLTDP
jgi:hypothetical protein